MPAWVPGFGRASVGEFERAADFPVFQVTCLPPGGAEATLRAEELPEAWDPDRYR